MAEKKEKTPESIEMGKRLKKLNQTSKIQRKFYKELKSDWSRWGITGIKVGSKTINFYGKLTKSVKKKRSK